MPLWRFRLVARTHASHAWNTGSIPVGATKESKYGENWWLGHMPLTPCFYYEHEFDSRRRYCSRTHMSSIFFIQLTMLAFRIPPGTTIAVLRATIAASIVD